MTTRKHIKRKPLIALLNEVASYFATREPADEDKSGVLSMAKRVMRTSKQLKHGWRVSK